MLCLALPRSGAYSVHRLDAGRIRSMRPAAVWNIRGQRWLQNRYALPQLPRWEAPVAPEAAAG